MRMYKKHPNLKRHLRQMSNECGPHAKLPTVRQLCSDFGESSAVVYQVLKDLEEQGVLYCKQGSGIYVSPKTGNKSIAILYGSRISQVSRNSPFWDTLLHLIINEAKNRAKSDGLSFTIHVAASVPDGEDRLTEETIYSVESGDIDGMILVSVNHEICEWLESRTPLISYASGAKERVHLEDEGMSRMAVGSLYAASCRRIGLWYPSYHALTDHDSLVQLQSANLRREQFIETLHAHNLEFCEEYSRINALDTSRHCVDTSAQEQGYRLVYEMMKNDPDTLPDGIFFDIDMMAVGALIAFAKLGVKIGQDIRIVSHANAGTLSLFGFEDEITRLEFDPAELVNNMFSVLDYKLKGLPVPQALYTVNPVLKPQVSC